MSVKLRTRKLKTGEYSFYLDIYEGTQEVVIDGKKVQQPIRRYKSLGQKYHPKRTPREEQNKIKELAEEILIREQLRQKTEKQIEVAKKHGVNPANYVIKDFIEYFERVISLKKKTTQKNYRGALFQINNFLNDDTNYYKPGITIGSITANFAEDFRAYLQKKNLKESSINSYLRCIKHILNKAFEENLIKENVSKKIKLTRDEFETVYLTEDEIEKLINTDTRSEQLKYAFLFSCYSGLRISDVEQLKKSNIVDNYLRIKQAKSNTYLSIPLHQNAKEILDIAWKLKKTESEIIFDNLPSSQARSQSIKRWVKRAGINKKITFHKSRHTFGTNYQRYNKDIYSTKEYMGHKKIETTMRYAKIVDEDLENSINKLPIKKIDILKKNS